MTSQDTQFEEKESVQAKLNSQREESEAREIIKDIGNLYSVPLAKKGRWIWELLQNARDCAIKVDDTKVVNITVTLDEDKLTFEHDGKLFTINNLISLFRKTSDKPGNGEEGNTGKYGTGFVTTHHLSKVVYIESFIAKKEGYTPFRLTMNRTFEEISDLQLELVRIFEEIEAIRISKECVSDIGRITKFEFPLNEKSKLLAENTVQELLTNVHFTLLCNRQIKSIRILNNIEKSDTIIRLSEPEKIADKIEYFPTSNSNGLLYFEQSDLQIGLPVIKQDSRFEILEIGAKARLYKEFPMVGTEGMNIPVFLQSHLFSPPEPRDGIRIIKDDENIKDKVADNNREILKNYPSVFKDFFTQLLDKQLDNIHLLVESGMPEDPYTYNDKQWYESNIQTPLREFFQVHPIVTTVKGCPKTIGECKFVDFPYEDQFHDFYSLCAELHPNIFPNESTYKTWDKIIHQSQLLWPKEILYYIEDLVEDIANHSSISDFPFASEEETLGWFKKFHALLKSVNLSAFADKKKLYPNQKGNLELRTKLKLDTLKNQKLKTACELLGFPITEKLVHPLLENKVDFEELNTEETIGIFHSQISKYQISTLDSNQIDAVLSIVCLFRTSKSPARTTLYSLISEVISISEITEVNDMEYYDWGTVDLMATKYLAHLVQSSVDIQTFAETYFSDNQEVCLTWLLKFYDFLASNEKNREVRENCNVILVQSGKFVRYSPLIFAEATQEPFNKDLKDIVKEHATQGDPYNYLVDNRLNKEQFTPIELSTFTDYLDSLFRDSAAENKVKEGQPYNQLFHKINTYISGQSEETSKTLFPSFMQNRPVFLLKALGTEISNKVLVVDKMNRSVDELKLMVNLESPADKLLELDKAALLVGHDKLIEQALIINENNEKAAWRKSVGNMAEDAFRKAIEGIYIELEIDNPDHGMDFTLKIKNNYAEEYSVEIKSTGIGVDSVSMSETQGTTAWQRPDRYALCVIRRDENNQVLLDHFLQNARFKIDIGTLIGDKMKAIKSGLKNLTAIESGDIVVSLENKKYSVTIMESVWSKGMLFKEFVEVLREYFQSP